jgi:hypothetical protein
MGKIVPNNETGLVKKERVNLGKKCFTGLAP